MHYFLLCESHERDNHVLFLSYMVVIIQHNMTIIVQPIYLSKISKGDSTVWECEKEIYTVGSIPKTRFPLT